MENGENVQFLARRKMRKRTTQETAKVYILYSVTPSLKATKITRPHGNLREQQM